ncbi:VC0807 family protein [Amycolatopsis panacis]|nr:VC0807 family protein [Amycolatopsis panacis]
MSARPVTAPLRRMAPSLVVNAVVPLALYLVLRTPVGEVPALAIGASVPLLVTVGELAVRRRIDPIGVVSIAGFTVLLVVLVLSGGSELVLKLRDTLLTGPVGIVFLGSALIGKPLLPVLMRFAGKRGAESEGRLTGAARQRALTVLTALIGGMLVLHALVILMLALLLPTATFLTVSQPAGWAVAGLGVLVCLAYRNRARATA